MDAATPQQHLRPRTQPENNQDRAAWMRRRLRNPSNSPRVFAHHLDNNKPQPRTSGRQQPPARKPTRSHPALKVGGMDAADRVVVRSENRGGRMPPALHNPLRPGRAAHERKWPPPDQSQGSPQEADAYEQRRTDDGRAAWMRRRRNKTSSRAPNLRTTGTEPHGCGGQSQPPEQCHRVHAPPR